MKTAKPTFRQRVINAAAAVLKQDKEVGLLEVFQKLWFLEPVHVAEWKNGNEHLTPIEPHIQCGEKKFNDTIRIFHEWVQEQELEPFEFLYLRNGRNGAEPLQVTRDDNHQREMMYRTHFRPKGLSNKQKQKIESKANKVPDLKVFVLTSDESECVECEAKLLRGDFLFLEKKEVLCLSCADLDHLEFLPSGDAAMTRRSKKHSSLAAIVVQFNRRRKRYERQGILVTSEAITKAETECFADADVRAERREKDAKRRKQDDAELVKNMTTVICQQYPGCSVQEANEIARQTAVRGSGRVGRSSAGRALEVNAIKLAVRAWVRHQHTDYDALLMKGVERHEARRMISETMEAVLASWAE